MDKIYFSISEVATLLQVTQSNLRFWEKEFKQLSPKRNDKGTRFYTSNDIQTIKNIIYLVDDQKLTLEGARRKLAQKKTSIEKQQQLVERLKVLRQELVGISKALDI